MDIKYDISISNDAIVENIKRITNQIFKLLPSREEGEDWKTPLENLILEIVGMKELLNDQVEFFHLLCKMESLLTLTKEDDFLMFRKTIFECLGMINKLAEDIKCL